MIKYLLDTCVITDFIKERGCTVQNLLKTSKTSLAISSITISEISYGLKKIEGSKKHKEIKEISTELLSQIEVINIDKKLANEAGYIRHDLSRQGLIIGKYDILIGATAKYNNLIMVTSNTKEFNRIEGLKLENWR